MATRKRRHQRGCEGGGAGAEATEGAPLPDGTTTEILKKKVKVRSSASSTSARSRADLVEQSALYAYEALSVAHPEVPLQPPVNVGERLPILDCLIRTILSQNTTDVTSAKAFAGLKSAFPTWRLVLEAPDGKAADAIRCGGLADIKVGRIKGILRWLLEHRTSECGGAAPGEGEPSMEYLRDWSDAEIKAELGQFKGVGPKTTSCVLCFSMARDTEFPVDTHVWRIARERLGWVPKSASREETYTILNELLPNSIKYGLHVLLVKHGKVCPACSASKSSGATRPQDKKGLRSRPCVLTAGRKGAAGDKTMGSKLISLCK